MMRRTAIALSFLAASLFAVGCATPDSTAEKVADSAANLPSEGFNGHNRLPDTVVPTSYDLRLTIDPAQETFSGTASITVELAAQTDQIALHAEELNITRAWVNVGKAKYDAQVVPGTNGGVTLVVDQPIGPSKARGRTTLVFEYTAPLDEEPQGLYRVEEGGEWYAFTQFQPLEAREAFPSFDEPRFKTPFQTSITVPAGQKAFANTLETDVREGEQTVTYVFDETEPLPTYLVAFAAGPLEVAEAPEGAIPNVPLRVITTKGKTKLAQYALEQAPGLLKAQSDYFGMPMPYSKIDMVAVPNFAAGAMENVGLITYRERLLLLDPDTATIGDKYALQSVMAHEFAHMWFGNYVTPKWWNDLWLNEAFATWMATRTLAEVSPELEARIDATRGSLRVMSADALAKARAIRQPIRGGGDVYNAFDGITYTKGRAVLQMFEAWMGEEDFRDGVRAFIEANAHGTGTTAELLRAWTKTSGKPVAETMRNFLDQPGVPLVEVDSTCADGKLQLAMSQQRFLPAGSEAEQGEPWHIPMCIKYGVDGQTEQTCAVLDAPEKTVTIEAESCPAWIHPNAEEAGYYHWKLSGDALVELATRHRDELSQPEKVALLPHAEALVEARELSYKTYLELVGAMSAEDHRAIVGQVVGAMYDIEEIAVDESNRAAFEAWAKEVVGPYADKLGFEGDEGESVEARRLRPSVIRAAADLAGEARWHQKAEAVTEKYLKDAAKVPLAQVELGLRIAAWDGNEVLWMRLADVIDDAPTPAARVATIRALGSFRNPKLTRKSLDLFLTDQLRAQDFWTVMGPTLGEPQTRKVAWEWLTQNYDAVVDKLGQKSATSLPWVGSGFCTPERKEQVAAFFTEDRQVDGTARNLAKALESIERCVSFRAYVKEDARRFLEARE